MDAIDLLGGTKTGAAKAIGVSFAAVNKWPERLPSRISDRVIAALVRKSLPPDWIKTIGQAHNRRARAAADAQ